MVKKLLRPLPFFIFTVLLIGCGGGDEKKKSVPSTVVKGSFSHPRSGMVELRDRVGPFTYADTVIARDTIEGGAFRMRFKKENLDYVTIKDSSQEVTLFLSPGDSLIVRRNVHGKLHFRGQGAEKNRYLTHRKTYQDSLARVQNNIFEMEKDSFLQAFRKRKRAFRSFRRNWFNSNDKELSARFKRLERLRDRIGLALTRFSYPDVYTYENPNDSIEFSRQYWAFLDSIDLNDTLLLHTPQFLSFAYDVANKYTLQNKGKQKSMSYQQMLFGTICEEFEGKVKDAVLTYFMLEQLRYSKNGVPKEILSRYRKEVEDPEMRSYVKKKLEKKKKGKDRPL